MARRNERGNPDTPIGFMDHIEAVFEDEGMFELQGNSEHTSGGRRVQTFSKVCVSLQSLRLEHFLQTFFDALQTFCRLYLIGKPLSCILFADFLS